MGVDYVIDQECGPKQRHTADTLVEMMKSRSAAEAIIADMRRNGDNRPLSELSITRRLHRPDGDTETKVTMAELLAQSAPLDQEKLDCARCAADRRQGGFGCTGRINYPIPEAAEQWLLARLPEDPKSPTMHLLMAAIKDFNFLGAPSRRMRDAGTAFFDAREAPQRAWGKRKLFGLGGPPFSLTTDQLFEMMFHVGSIKPTHGAMLCAFFGVIPLTAIHDREALARASVTIPDGSGAAQLAMFLQALAFAAAHDLTVSISA
jgi:hypothetical protein